MDCAGGVCDDVEGVVARGIVGTDPGEGEGDVGTAGGEGGAFACAVVVGDYGYETMGLFVATISVFAL